MADVEIKYNNATIASLNDSGTEVLETNGTFLTDDITVEYTKSSGGESMANIVYVDYTYTETDSAKTWTLTKTAGEILSLLKSGKIVFIQVDTDVYYQLACVQRSSATSNFFKFPFIDPNPVSQSNLTYPKIIYAIAPYTANGLTAYPAYGAQTGGSND
jgi:hypothetical protein